MGEIGELQLGREYKIAVFSGRVFKIYDGKGKDNVSEERSVARKSFGNSVMKEIGNSVPFQVIDGGLFADNTQNPDTETVIEYVGPKRLPKVTLVKKQTESQNQRIWNIRNFFRKGNPNE